MTASAHPANPHNFWNDDSFETPGGDREYPYAHERHAEFIPREVLTADTDSTRQYLNEIGRIPLLCAEEEISCARSIELGREALHTFEHAPHLTTTQRKVLLMQIEQAAHARKTLIESNLRLVVSIAKHHQGRGLTLLDLIQEGNLGLIQAADKFEYRRGHRFTTYATWWVRQAIGIGLARSSRSIRLPMDAYTHTARIHRFSQELEQVLSREPLPAEVAEAMGADWTAERVAELAALMQPVGSLDTPVADGSDLLFGDLIPGSYTRPEDRVAERQLRVDLDELLSHLTPREASVLRLRAGMDENGVHTLAEVGQLYNLTRERIRQIENGALKKLRSQHDAARRLAGYLHN